MANKKRKSKIGIISANTLLKRTRGINNVGFKTGVAQGIKDKPRDKNWRKWV